MATDIILKAMELAETPPEDREEEKKFYFRFRWEDKQFTLKEIEEVKKKFANNLTDFYLVEVEDEN